MKQNTFVLQPLDNGSDRGDRIRMRQSVFVREEEEEDDDLEVE